MNTIDKKVIIGFIIWGIAVFATIPKSKENSVDIRKILDLPSIKKMADDEMKRVQEERMIHEFEKERVEKERKRKKDVVSRGDFQGRKYRVEKLIVTAYAPYDNKSGICNDGDPSRTSTGTKPDWGTVAVNPKRFPYGTEFYIEGYGYGKGLDTGGAMRKNSRKIDLFFMKHSDAMKWGVKEMDVIIFEDEDNN
ncbi:3D domain-containing protein [Tissierella praeacuta]|uniref:3D domain-containing protein n=1 Tax=Tissierella praeacuta TaxID=43131 RepID=UPI003DA341EE